VLRFVCLNVLVAIAAVAPAGEPTPPVRTEKKVRLEEHKSDGVDRIHRFGDIYLASQPSADALKSLKEQGVVTIINLREAAEMDWDEAAEAEKLGFHYEHVPIGTLKSLSDETFGKLRKLLSDPERKSVCMHCASANRVGAVWLAHRVLDDKVDYQAAAKEAKTIGLRSPELERIAREYIERRQKPDAAPKGIAVF